MRVPGIWIRQLCSPVKNHEHVTEQISTRIIRLRLGGRSETLGRDLGSAVDDIKRSKGKNWLDAVLVHLPSTCFFENLLRLCEWQELTAIERTFIVALIHKNVYSLYQTSQGPPP